MDPDYVKKPDARLGDLDEQSLKFYEAKQTSLSEGYSDKKMRSKIVPSIDTDAHSSVQSRKSLHTNTINPVHDKSSLLSRALAFMAAGMALLGCILSFILRPFPSEPEMYWVMYLYCGVTLALVLLAILTRTHNATWRNVLLICVTLVSAGGAFLIARDNENIVKLYQSGQCKQITWDENTNFTETSGALPTLNSRTPSDCTQRLNSK